MIRILVVDDHPLVREGLVGVLTSEPDFAVVGQAATAEEALFRLPGLRATVAVVDARLPGMSGLRAVGELRAACPRLAVVLLASSLDPAAVRTGTAAGAAGVVVKGSRPAVLRDAVRAVAAGGDYVDPDLRHGAAAARPRR